MWARARLQVTSACTISEFAEALEPFTIWQGVYAEQLQSLDGQGAVSKETSKILQHIDALVGLLGDAAPTCDTYTRLSQVYLDTFRFWADRV